jgi:hypothetical protein
MSSFRSASSIRTALVLAVLAQMGCSHHEDAQPAYRSLGSGVLLSPCAVGDDYVYGVPDPYDAHAIKRVSRKTGVVETISDVELVTAMVATNHQLYWIDYDGVHAWAEGATTRTEIRSVAHADWSSSLVHFGDRLCWGVWLGPSANEPWNGDDASRAECLRLPGGAIEKVVFRNRVGAPILAAGFGRLYARLPIGSDSSEILDLTDSFGASATPPQRVVQLSQPRLIDFSVTSAGPAFLEITHPMPEDPVLLGLLLLPKPHNFALPADTGALTVIDGRAIVKTPRGPTQIDPGSGASTLLASIHGGPDDGFQRQSSFCGDKTTLFVEGPNSTIFEVPLATNKGSDHERSR